MGFQSRKWRPYLISFIMLMLIWKNNYYDLGKIILEYNLAIKKISNPYDEF